MKRGRRLEEEEEEKERKSAMLFGSEDTFDSIASLEEKVNTLSNATAGSACTVIIIIIGVTDHVVLH